MLGVFSSIKVIFIFLPSKGFSSNQLKVQVTSTGKLRVSGDRQLINGKWLRFQKEIDIPADADTDNISAKLEHGILYVKQPKKPSATSSNIPPVQQPKPKAESQPPPAATKPTADPPNVRPNAPKSQNERPEPPESAATEPTVAPPTVRPNARKRLDETVDTAFYPGTKTYLKIVPKSEDGIAKQSINPKKYHAPRSVGANPPKSQNERPQSQASGKQIPTPPKPQGATGAPARIPKPGETSSIGSGQPVEDLAKKDKTKEKGKAHTKLQDALEKTREDGKEEEGGSKMAEKEKEEVGIAKPSIDAKKFHVPRSVGANPPKSQNDRPQSQASGKQIPTPPKPQEATGAPASIPKPGETSSMGSGQPIEDLAKEDKTEEKGKAHTKLQDALEKTSEEGGSKMAEKEKEEVEKEKRRRMKRMIEEMGEESGRLRRRERYKQVIDGVVKELRTNMVTLALGVAVFGILYLNLSKKGHVEEEL